MSARLANALALEPVEPPGPLRRRPGGLHRVRGDRAPQIGNVADASRIPRAISPRARYCRSGACRSAGRAIPNGAPRFDDGAAVSARGWAQAGELIRREGVWRAQQLADDGALREAVRGSFAEARAGFGLWLASARAHARSAQRGERSVARLIARADRSGDGGGRRRTAALSRRRPTGMVIVRQARSLIANANGRTPNSCRWSGAGFRRADGSAGR